MRNFGIVCLVLVAYFLLIETLFEVRSGAESRVRLLELQRQQEAEAVWTVRGPYQGIGGPQSSNMEMFLLDHPTLGRRLIGKHAFVGCTSPDWKVPWAVVEQYQGEKTFSHPVSYREILVDFPTSRPNK